MLRYGRNVAELGRGLRRLSVAVEPTSTVEPKLHQNFMTNEINPANHNITHEGRFYAVPQAIQKQLFTYGGLPKTFTTLVNTLNELALMVRSPAIEVIDCLKSTDFTAPVLRYALYGKLGTGKTTSLAHILHYGTSAGFLLVHVPWAPSWFRNHSVAKEATPSATRPPLVEQPSKSVEWLRHFGHQNGSLLRELQLKTTETRTWSKRETTPAGSSLLELIELGLNRAKYATDVIDALLTEIKRAAVADQCRVLVVVDGFNAFFSSQSMVRRIDRSVVPPAEFALTKSFLSIIRNDWNNGAVVVSVDSLAHPADQRASHLPRYLLGQQGFEWLDPFVPVAVNNYSDKEAHSQISYYADRRWLVNPNSTTDAGLRQLIHASSSNPFTLMQLVAPY